MKIYIYKLIDPITFQVRYIGKTNNLKERLWNHLSEARRCIGKSRHLINWLRSLIRKKKKPRIELLEECDENNWTQREKYWIATYRKSRFNLCNICKGGLGGSGHKYSDQEKLIRGNKLRSITMKISHEKACKIWHMIRNNYSLEDIKLAYPQVTRQTVFEVKTGRRWNNITGLIKPVTTKGIRNKENHPHAKLSSMDVVQIRQLHKNNVKQIDICKKFKISPGQCSKICNYKKWN